MRLFKSDEEKLNEYENTILNEKEYIGLVGASNTGYTLSEGFTNSDKIRFKKTKFKIFDDRIMIERHRTFINLSDVKEIFQETDDEALIILNNEDIVPIAPVNPFKNEYLEFKAFMKILNRLVKENKSINNENSEDKFDKLIKLGDMHDKGLLSDEEFALLKQELLAGNIQNTPSTSNNVEHSINACENCGADVSPDDTFCCECGTQLNEL